MTGTNLRLVLHNIGIKNVVLAGIFTDQCVSSTVRSLADELRTEGAVGEGSAAVRALEPIDRIFATLACHAARRKGDVLSEPEQRALLDAVDTIPWAPTCPHGRPVVAPFDLAEIERRFSRR